MAYLLDASTQIACPHGGQGIVVASNQNVLLGGSPALVSSDTVTISGCSFTISGSPSPCLTVQWQAPATRVKVSGTPVLLSSSVALCMSAANVPQGTAALSGYQTKVQGQ
ncbi:MAG TPA: hypothetical protein VFQ71_12940 [Gaiellales bacterium]|jgi:hypothetical protein|nr:hypothetical protein [Gaiellales bacterium]